MNCRKGPRYTRGCRCAGCRGQREKVKQRWADHPDEWRRINRRAAAQYRERHRLAYQMYFDLLQLSGLRRQMRNKHREGNTR